MAAGKGETRGSYSPGSVRKRGDRWQLQLRYRDSAGGKWRTASNLTDIKCQSTGNAGERTAKKALAEWRAAFIEAHEAELAEAARGATLTASTTAEYVAAYIDTLDRLGREGSTIAGYRRMEKYVRDGAPLSADSPEDVAPLTIGQIPLDDLSREAIQAWLNDMAERLAPVTVKKALTVLRAALKNACRDGRLSSNPADYVDPPAMRKAAQNPLTDEQQRALLADLDAYTAKHPEDPSRLALKTALLTGMRQGEICALRWADVDLGRGTIEVKQAIGRRGDAFKSGNASYYLKEPKNGGSRREIPIPATLAKDMAERRRNVQAKCMAEGVRFSAELYVFGSIDGDFMNPHGLWMKWKRISKRLGLVGLDGNPPKFHDLRHTFATTAIKHGMDVKTLSSILGHANAAMTLNIYASADPNAKRAAMDRMGDFYDRLTSEGPREADVLTYRATGTEGR